MQDTDIVESPQGKKTKKVPKSLTQQPSNKQKNKQRTHSHCGSMSNHSVNEQSKDLNISDVSSISIYALPLYNPNDMLAQQQLTASNNHVILREINDNNNNNQSNNNQINNNNNNNNNIKNKKTKQHVTLQSSNAPTPMSMPHCSPAAAINKSKPKTNQTNKMTQQTQKISTSVEFG